VVGHPEKKTNDYGDIMAAGICSMVQTNFKNCLFVSDYNGC
jgi:WD40 repeat protein